ncbi:Mono(2-hydroxyethyl) terephthalate hydrolase [Paraburkholderia domus]|uniref:Mono(2-hydroxyethyl) terephthalate hydrolase n=1 Tax=Paraburkholderia domus TaxID=2793075 RepID=A0A9N8MST5_9BURK|nr:tannase/feruloyl esterase family alpha/beta hydrolase [Paraburkholderia domus]MBK5085292.1 tannase/feruloyl esterase family alpha/beta hydrolase [Burkholderia sp. R-69927]MBK5164178.1 tannase/feruloyl esterase family alpha/beta hydrolase [Burkholderia sp. R-70211]CAE6771735.1 Mono(2-hydroxyethyl) terephthalate hydrolase [Paraburkholderia domus]CAE6827438.1 Mono(2-hydroxyethyl) terephthalate hydrolase [Paraburkholderia domus]CAE6867169.1 Mono(2-hydroxyethyl) terephthalate hydrolase [Paraburk
MKHTSIALAAAAALTLAACGGNDVSDPAVSSTSANALPQLSAASPGTLAGNCAALAAKLTFANTVFTSVTDVAAGTLNVAGKPIAEHCLIQGSMNQRVSNVDGKTYAIGFEMRLPLAWNGRFFYQANGGLDGNVVTATGEIGGGGPTNDALNMGFAVISSDAGHSAAQNPLFGLDPQARLDYGYNAVATLTPMAKQVIKLAYGKGPDRSYFDGCSNGGRHALVAAARSSAEYDGIIAGDPGFHLPKAAIGEMWSAQQLAKAATATTANGLPDITTGFTATERQMVASKILAKCDALDGASDGLIQDIKACQANFSLATDVPTCTNNVRDGTCLTSAQKDAIGNVFSGARNSAGTALYSSFPYDAGLGPGWSAWKQANSITLDPAAAAFTFTTPPQSASVLSQLSAYALNFSMDTDAPKIFATSGVYNESAWSFMTPPDETSLSALKQRGAKLMVYHGTSDPVFSSNDTTDWYQRLMTANGGDASNFARLYTIAGMNHCSGGPSTDQFDMLTPMIAWVEQGKAPDSVVATARDASNVVPNTDVPANWGAGRTRPLCAYPKVARYQGGNIIAASSFACS